MEDKDQTIAELKELILNLGNAAADLIEQALTSDFTDAHGHSLMMNQAFIDLGNALQGAVNYAEAHGGCDGN